MKKSQYLFLIFVELLSFIIILNISLNKNLAPFDNLEEKPMKQKEQIPSLSGGRVWSINGKAICTENFNQENLHMCSDGAGGAIIVWQDNRSGSSWDIYAQRISPTGVTLWQNNGKLVCNASNNQENPQICFDGSGGAIIVWQDNRSGSDWDIYAQRININGELQWLGNGTVICNESDQQEHVRIVSDAYNGAIITWQDSRSGIANYNIYAQRINSTGIVKWNGNGTIICNETGHQGEPELCGVGAGGAIITWEDQRAVYSDIYAQLINSTGDVKWDGNGTVICDKIYSQQTPKICSDGVGGAIITWKDKRKGLSADFDIYAERISNLGAGTWNSSSGIVVCYGNSDQLSPEICGDGAQGAFIVWTEDDDIRAQRLNSAGNIQWSLDGIPICTAVGIQDSHHVISDELGGSIIAWRDLRYSNAYIFAQRLHSNGTIRWANDGVKVTFTYYSQDESCLCSDKAGGAIIAWKDAQGVSNYDIYAQRIESSLPYSNHPDDIEIFLNGTETLNWTLYNIYGGGLYRVLANDTMGNMYVWRDWASWVHSVALNIPINKSEVGNYIYTIEYTDDIGQSGTADSIIVSIIITSTPSGNGEQGDMDPSVLIFWIIFFIALPTGISFFLYFAYKRYFKKPIPEESSLTSSDVRDSSFRDVEMQMLSPTAITEQKELDSVEEQVSINLNGAETKPKVEKAKVPKKSKASFEGKNILTPEEFEELRRTESEIDIQETEFICVVHKGPIDTAIYLCPDCKTFYCFNCAKALKEKGESCWACGSEIKL
jgi:hypothetical protein